MEPHAQQSSLGDRLPPRTHQHQALRQRIEELEQEMVAQDEAHTRDRLELHRQHMEERGVSQLARRVMQERVTEQLAELEVLRHASREGRLQRQALRCELALAREVEESTRSYCDRLEKELSLLNGGKKPSFK